MSPPEAVKVGGRAQAPPGRKLDSSLFITSHLNLVASTLGRKEDKSVPPLCEHSQVGAYLRAFARGVPAAVSPVSHTLLPFLLHFIQPPFHRPSAQSKIRIPCLQHFMPPSLSQSTSYLSHRPMPPPARCLSTCPSNSSLHHASERWNEGLSPLRLLSQNTL